MNNKYVIFFLVFITSLTGTSVGKCYSISTDDYSYDADGFLWGTEIFFTNDQKELNKRIDIINNVLKTKNVKFGFNKKLLDYAKTICLQHFGNKVFFRN